MCFRIEQHIFMDTYRVLTQSYDHTALVRHPILSADVQFVSTSTDADASYIDAFACRLQSNVRFQSLIYKKVSTKLGRLLCFVHARDEYSALRCYLLILIAWNKIH